MFKRKIIIIIAFLIIIIITAGYLIYQAAVRSRSSAVPENGISLFLNNLKNDVGLDFSAVQEVEFSWMAERGEKIEEKNIAGKKIEVKQISEGDYNKIENYFEISEFKADDYNIASGTIVGLVGYKKDDIICLVIRRLCSDEESCSNEKLFDNPENDISIKCGYFDDSSELLSQGEILEPQIIEIKAGDNFFLSLKANLTTGYQWQPDFDYNYIGFVDVNYNPSSPELMGSPGTEVFEFKALDKGETKISFSYLRPWEEKAPLQKAVYTIIIE